MANNPESLYSWAMERQEDLRREAALGRLAKDAKAARVRERRTLAAVLQFPGRPAAAASTLTVDESEDQPA